MSKDYYKILGVAEFDSAEEIKRAYRRLARQFHPDIAGNNSDTLARFKEINEAYNILSNRVKKEEYDRARRFYNYAKSEKKSVENENNKFSHFEKKNCFSFCDFFAKKNYNQNINNDIKLRQRGENINSDIEITLLESINGSIKIINMLQTEICPICHGRKFINGSKCAHCNGKGELSNYKKFTVKIPAGVSNKSKIRLAGAGGAGKNGGENGDLYLTVHVIEPKSYKTDGLNIHKTIPISPFEAVLGCEINISGLNGNLKVKIAPNTQNGQKIRLSGCGIVQNEKVGDMIITVEIKIPNNLSKEEISLYEKLRDFSTSNIRETDYDR